jgi:hypothetical protein
MVGFTHAWSVDDDRLGASRNPSVFPTMRASKQVWGDSLQRVAFAARLGFGRPVWRCVDGAGDGNRTRVLSLGS